MELAERREEAQNVVEGEEEEEAGMGNNQLQFNYC